MVICIVGDIDLEKGFHLVKKYFGDLQRRSFSPPSVPEEPPLLEKREVRIPMEKRQVHMIIGFPCTTIFNPDRYPMEVLNTILSAQGGRLFVELRDRESLAYSLDSFFVAGLDTGYFGIYLATSPEKVKRAEDGIKRELRRIISDAPTDEEVEIAKGNIVGNFEIGLQGLSSQAMTMALHELYGLGFNEIKRYPEKILSVRRGDVLNVARKYIDIHRSVVVMVGPVYGD
jgi:zinc protease